jgi:GH43 family beta-xylosidase
VLESVGADPLGPYNYMGRLHSTNEDFFHIDGSVYKSPDGKLYHVWSGLDYLSRDGDPHDDVQSIFISEMSNPWTLKGDRVKISTPRFSWERTINEGPEIYEVKGTLLGVLFSAHSCWGNDYCLGYLQFSGGDLLDPNNWNKIPHPIYSTSSEVIAPGHCSCVSTDDGSLLFFHYKNSFSHTHAERRVGLRSFEVNQDGVPVVS